MTNKLITIPHNGPIIPLGGVYGPITHPYRLDMTSIRILVSKGYAVDEHLDNGEILRLNLTNYSKDNNAENGIKVERLTETIQPEPVEVIAETEAPRERLTETIQPEPVEVIAETEADVKTTQQQPSQKQGKKNRNRQDNVEKK